MECFVECSRIGLFYISNNYEYVDGPFVSKEKAQARCNELNKG